MKRLSIILCALMLALAFAGAASAQIIPIPPGGSQFNPPPPPPPAPPSMAPPVVPQMDAPVHPNYAPAPRQSFSERITKCLDDAAAAGYGPNKRANYSRSCANR